MILLFIIVIIIIILNEIYEGICRQYQRNKIYEMAEKHAKKLKKILVVVGDPYYGKGSKFYNIFMDGYKCGDKTVDLTGAPKCPNGIKNDLYNYLKTQESNSQIIFISCVLEYIDNIAETVEELYRVTGGPENIFVVTVKEHSLAAYFYSEDDYSSKNLIYAPPEYKKITWKKI